MEIMQKIVRTRRLNALLEVLNPERSVAMRSMA
jgi:hypothetical protein